MKYTAWHLNITLLVAIMLTIFVAISVSHSKTIKIGVEGMVCDFCAQSIQKVFLKQAGVESGPPPEKGPMSQGLLSLYKNGRKL